MKSPVPSAPATAPAADIKVLLTKIAWRLIPFMCFLYLLAYLDRVNVGFAALQMTKDLHFSDTVYGLGAGIFFIGYFLFEVPSNLILQRAGARTWIARIMITWGIVAAAMVFVRGPWTFYVLRFLLGLAEAGFFPGMVLYLSFWFPPAYRARTTALFFTSTALAGVFGGPISGMLLTLDGHAGLKGWQWLFLLEGIPSVIAGFAVYVFLTDRPANARWLTESERTQLEAELERTKIQSQPQPDRPKEKDHSYAPLTKASPASNLTIVQPASAASPIVHARFTTALLDFRLWLLSSIYFTLMIGLYGVNYWMPKILKSVTHFSDRRVSFTAAIPYAAATIAMVIIGRRSDRTRERRWHVALSCVAAAVGFSLAPFCHSALTVVLAFSLAAIGVWSSVGPFWALPGAFLGGAAAAGGIAAINSIGNLGGFAGPYLMGLLKTLTSNYAFSLWFVAAAMLAGAALVLSVRVEPPAASDASSA